MLNFKSNPVFISVVIPTFNRSNYLLKILSSLKKNYLNYKYFEVIICDSYSKDSTFVKLKNFISSSPFIIKYFNIKDNIHSKKRNLGITKANGKYIALLDDDCIPEIDWLKNYNNILNKKLFLNKKIIFCGSVKYPNFLSKKKFIKYRQNTHFHFETRTFVSKINLEPKNIVTMNMAFHRKRFLDLKSFNKNFNNYGFEDYELGYRYTQSNFQIKKCGPRVFHYDTRDYASYLNKIQFLGNKSMKYLVTINKNAAKKLIFYKLENNFFINFFISFFFFFYILKLMTNISILIDKYFFYIKYNYKIGIAASYLVGVFLRRKKIPQNNLISWYK